MRETLSTDRFEADHLFRSAFEFAAIGMALVAPNGRFLRVNRSLSRNYRLPGEGTLRANFSRHHSSGRSKPRPGLCRPTFARRNRNLPDGEALFPQEWSHRLDPS